MSRAAAKQQNNVRRGAILAFFAAISAKYPPDFIKPSQRAAKMKSQKQKEGESPRQERRIIMDNNMNDELRRTEGEDMTAPEIGRENVEAQNDAPAFAPQGDEQVAALQGEDPAAAPQIDEQAAALQNDEQAAALQEDAAAFAPQGFAQQTPPPAPGFMPQASNGAYGMPRPANGTTYYRAPQGAPNGAPQRAEWSNAAPQYGAPNRNPYSHGAPYAPGDAQRQQPYGAYGAQGYARQAQYGQSTAPAASSTITREPKQKKGVSAGVVAIICAVCVLLSGVAGFAGARLAKGETSTKYEVKESDTPASVGNQSDTTVLYRSVSTDSEAKTTATVTDVVNAVADSVVEITTEFKSTGFWQFVQSGAGSGVIISNDGYIMTNNHVIVNEGAIADTITVRLRDGTEYDAKVVGHDEDADIAVIKIEASDLTAAVFGDSSKLVVGEDIVAIGNPLGELGGTVTEGIVSALDREVDVEGTKMNLLQISAAINPGNSGGGLFNMKGELVGVVNAKSSGSGIEGLGFAIPSNDASHIAEEIIAHGYVTGKPYIGISTYYASDEFTAYRYFRSQATGLYIVETFEGYNDKVLQQGDRIVEVDGKEIATADDLAKAVKNANIGDTMAFTVYRNGKRTEVEVKVYEYVPDDVDFNS